VHQITGISQIQCGLHPGDSTTDHHHRSYGIFRHFGLKFPSRSNCFNSLSLEAISKMPNGSFDRLTTLSTVEGPISLSGLNRNIKRIQGFKGSRIQVVLNR
jgi:hypothetical protein